MGAAESGERTWIDVSDRFEGDWEAGRRPRIEDYLADETGSRRARLLEQLLRVERQLRARAGEHPTREEYRHRFPGHEEVIGAVFATTQPADRSSRRQPSPPAAGAQARDVAPNLLFGLLALQNNFIGRDALVAAFSMWLADKARPLGQILVDLRALDEGRLALLDALVHEHLRIHGDDPARSLAALSSIDGATRQELGQLADSELQATLAETGLRGHGSDPDATASFRDPPGPGAPGRFRILRFHKAGGLGEVFVARDQELGRDVALKKIRPDKDHDELRTRFVLEAEITGGLEHPSIVPIYSLGTYADGRPYYAMRFLGDDSLRDVIQRYHEQRPRPDPTALEFRKLLGRLVDVCEAIAYAHSKGVLHRDLKPHNVMLGRYGETLLIDWGLAKATGRRDPDRAGAGEVTFVPPSAGEQTPTLPGLRMGSPPYMSPEQAAGKIGELNAATDVYGLGAILYALLTGQPPVPPRPDDSNEAICERAREGQIVPPRSLNPHIPRPLEAVCLKALQREPAGRYPSARALAEDLEHWLADEPVSAYPEPWPARLARWGRSHRPLVSGVAALLITAVVALSIGTVALSRANARSEENYQMARAAVDRYFTRISENRLLDEPRMELLRRELLETAREFYQQFVDRRRDDPAARADLGRAYIRLAWITVAVETRTAALPPAERARQVFARLAAEDPGNEQYRRDLAESLDVSGSVLSDLGRHAEAEPLLRQRVQLLEQLAAAHPEDLDLQNDLGRSLQGLGVHCHEVDASGEEARRLFGRAVEIHERLLHQRPGDPAHRYALASALGGLSDLERHRGELSEAVTHRERATELQAALAEQSPEVVRHRRLLANGLGKLGSLYRQVHRSADRSAVLERSLTLREGLAREHPAVADYQSELAEACSRLASARADSERWDEGAGLYQRAVQILERLVKRDQDNLTYRDDLATGLSNWGELEKDRGRTAVAERLTREAIRILEALCRDDPKSVEFPVSLARCYGSMGDLGRERDRGDRLARTWYDQATAQLDKVLARDPHQALAREYLRDVLWGRAQSLTRVGLLREALADCERALTLDEDGKYRLRLRLHRALMWAYLGDHARAAAEVEDVTGPTSGRLRRNESTKAARTLSVCAAGVGPASDRADAEWQRREAYAAGAVQHLARAYAAGMLRGPEEREFLLHDADFAALRPRPDFHLLLMDLGFPAESFTGDE